MEKLDTAVQELFGKVGALGAPPDAGVLQGRADGSKPATPEERAYWKAQNDYVKKVCALFTDEDIEQIKSQSELFDYPSADGTYRIQARFFRAPENNKNPPPLVIHFHGGGMTTLDRDTGYELVFCDLLRQMGCSVLTPEFRNAREYPFPAGIDDCLSTVLWAHEQQSLAILGIDGKTVVTVGGSGGANLSVAVFLRALEKKYDARQLIHGIFSDAPFIRPQYGNNPVMQEIFAPFTPPSILDDLCNNYTQSVEDQNNPSAWPLLATDEQLSKFPPTMLRGEEFDTLKEDAKELYSRLIELKVEGVTYAEYKNWIHCQYVMAGKNHMQYVAGEVAGFVKTIAFVNKNK